MSENLTEWTFTTLLAAELAHEANRAFCESIGDMTQLPWDQAPQWQKDSAIAGVAGIRSGGIARPEQSHESWMAHKLADGWTYGAEKNAELKTHPCMVPYAQLPAEQQVKDALFFAIVTTIHRRLS